MEGEGRSLSQLRLEDEKKVVTEEGGGVLVGGSSPVAGKSGRGTGAVKRQWEELLDSRCVCVMGSLFSKMEEILERQEGSESLHKSLLELECSRYRPLGEALVTREEPWPSPDNHPPRELLPDTEGGPKQVSEDDLLLIMQSATLAKGMSTYAKYTSLH